MTRQELRARLHRLGYITHDQAAAALGLSRPYVGRILGGERPVPDRVAYMMTLVEQTHPVILSPPMRQALRQARRPGDPVPYPAPTTARRPDWDEVYDAMHAMKLIHYKHGPTPRITRRGWAAVRDEG